jgi:anti-sigma-K factor RskA
MSARGHHDEALERELAAYALGELDAGERERIEHRLASEPGLRVQLAELSAALEAMSSLPAEAWDDVEAPALVSPAPKAPPRRTRRRSWAGSLQLRPAAVALAGAALALGVVIGVGTRPSARPSEPAIVATAQLLPLDGTSAGARGVFRLDADQTGSLAVSGLAPTDAGHVYELWLMDSTRDLIAVATFRVSASGHAQVSLPLPTSPSHFRYLDVSLQPLDGTALHSSRSVLRGRTPAARG